MKKHKFIEQLHCPDCFDKNMKSFLKWDREINSQRAPIILSPTQYEACQKYGYPKGLLHMSEFRRSE